MDLAPDTGGGDGMIGWIDGATDWLTQKGVPFKRGSLPRLYREVFDCPAGEIVLADLHRKAGVMHESLGISSEQLHETAGAQAMVLYIDKMLRLKQPALQHLADMEVLDG